MAGPRIIPTAAAMRAEVTAAQAAGRTVGFVPTMGALHAGHASLVTRAAAACDDVAVSIFVNPTQFGPGEDFDRYPRMLAADVGLLERHGVRWIYAPTAAEVYPPGDATRVVVAGPAEGFEGRIRPGHFAGVATVVCRLFNAVPATVAYFGAKDWQQTLVVKRMVRDLGLPVRVEVCPTVREADGLALSSRNAYLTAEDRQRAPAIYEALQRAAVLWRERSAVETLEAAVRTMLESSGLVVDYAAVVAAESLQPLADESTPAIALVAGRLGSTRLIDNMLLPARGAGN